MSDTVATQYKPLIGHSISELESFAESLDEKPFRGRQLFDWIYRQQVDDFSKMTDLSKSFREKLNEVSVHPLKMLNREESLSKQTRKFLFEVSGGKMIESVLMEEGRRITVCLSTQVGCAVDCDFCATAKMGFVKNLTAGEIVGQVMMARDDLGEWPVTGAPKDETRLLSNIVLMGMGEPLYNFENVRDAMKIAMDPEGIQLSRRRITLSTSGVVPEIARTAEEIGCQLAVSFHATTDDVRDKLVPINKRWNIAALLEALRAYPHLSNSERITFEYVMLDHVNDSKEDAHRLVELIKGIPAKINLIPFNEWPGAPYKRSSGNRIHAFSDIIHEAGYASPIRKPRGEDIMAACGQLKSATERARKSRKQIEAEAGVKS